MFFLVALNATKEHNREDGKQSQIEITHKSHLVLILPIAIREPRKTKKTNLWISLGHKSIKRNNANCLTTQGAKRSPKWPKRISWFLGSSSLASGNNKLPRVAKEHCLVFDYTSSTSRALSLKSFCWPQHRTFLDQFHRASNINNHWY